MPQAIRSNFWPVALLVRAELADFLDWHVSRIHIVAGDADVPYRTGDHDIVLRVQGEQPDARTIDGGGRQVNRRTRDFDIEVRTRMVLDPVDEDLQRLTTLSGGHLLLEDDVVDCLEDFFPTDENGNSLVVQGLVSGRWTKPLRDKSNPQWVTSTLDVECLIDRALDLARGT